MILVDNLSQNKGKTTVHFIKLIVGSWSSEYGINRLKNNEGSDSQKTRATSTGTNRDSSQIHSNFIILRFP